MRLGGTTSVDVTKPGIDKAYGIRKLRDTLGIATKDKLLEHKLYINKHDQGKSEILNWKWGNPL